MGCKHSQTRAADPRSAPACPPDAAIDLTDIVAVAASDLPPLAALCRPGCQVCGSLGRPLWSGVCAWCGADDDEFSSAP